jgi:pimeloyl-ACP methyl ester carboxylesterase
MDSSANVARAVSSPQPTSSPKPTSPSVSSSNAVEKKFNTDANNFIKNADKAITWNRKSLGDIEFIEAFLDNDDNKPLIFCLHGGGGSKEQMMGELDRYAHEGFYAVALDAAGCGDSQVGPLMAYKSFEATVGYIDSLIDYYKNVTQADIDNFAVSGASMGGSIAFCYAAHGKYKPKVIFPKSGTPDLLLNSDGPMFDCFDRGQAGQPQTMTEEELKAFAAEYSPINTPEHFLEVAIYAINGEKDDITPPTGCKNLESALKKLGHEDISFNYFRNAGHGDDMNDNDAGIKFLMQHVGLDV